ncbi:TraE/TraK family type IV conjugative transfer system protein [Pseudoalteromonas galatheae]|uniref:TraE/TraK family type IV conjugative transfer system protein n=1 Tax=Pseudoalteromonas galatheae TaxID=579562 RepID=UPI0030D2D9FD
MVDEKKNSNVRDRLQYFLQESSNVFAENKIMRYLVIGMVITSAFNTVLLQKALNDRTVIIQAPDGSYAYEISGKKADNSYLYRMARYVVFLSGNLTAATGRDQLNELLRLVHPSKYNDFQSHFNKLAKEIERYPNISYNVEINGDKAIDLKGTIITVNATKKRIIGNTVARKDRLSYELTFSIEAGRFWIMDLKEVTGAAKSGENQHES